MVEVAEDNRKKEKKGEKGEKKERRCKKGGEKVPMSGLNPRPPILHYHCVFNCTVLSNRKSHSK